jgi:hypothetical protein
MELPVVDDHGRSCGTLHDVHLVQDGPLLPSGMAGFRLHGFVAGRGSFGTRLGYTSRRGYDTGQLTRGPLPFKLLMRWLDRRSTYFPWTSVVSVEPSRVVVRSAGDGLDPEEHGGSYD